ncbi:MAG: thiamine-phosphate kinase, partial [Planctomycetaceae bacterium]
MTTPSFSGGEFEFIERVRARAAAHPRVVLGIGDDAAVLRFPDPADCLVAVDLLIEGVHFSLPPATARQAGRKALAVNLSDIAAMAGRPLAAVVSLAAPRDRGAAFLEEVHAGLEQLAEEFGVAIAGGDTNVWAGPLMINVTILGETTGRGAVRRSGARPDDWILVTGGLGGSLSGKHLDFRPRVEEALALHESADLHAMIDLSDGLAADLHHVLDESGVGAVIFADRVPISDAARACRDDRSPLDHALGDGEDFELLFTVAAEDGRRLLDQPPINVPLSHIGEITAERAAELIDSDGRRAPLPRAGWE